MATERSQHQQWAEAEIASLIELGIHPLDAQRAVDWVLDHLPYGEDPATYIFPAEQLWTEPSAPENVQDAAAAWMEEVQPRFARLLHAKEESE
jgi:hypothetical protein